MEETAPEDPGKGSAYERQALEQTICFCRIKRKQIRGKFRYYAELVMKGSCPVRKVIPPERREPSESRVL